MTNFLSSEKPNQIHFKLTSPSISPSARADGTYKGHAYPFCLPVEHAGENLYPEIRAEAMDFFARYGIHWHDGTGGKPSNHLCDSQVCCVNFLFPFGVQPEAFKQLLLPLFPQIDAMLPIEEDRYVSFEWIGARNYLGEGPPAKSPQIQPRFGGTTGGRTRGANCTSADAVVMFRRTDGRKQVVLIEWKYTESYGSVYYGIAKSGTDRAAIYRHLFDADDCPLHKELLPSFESLFYEPFYQFMRQQFLAHEMEKAHELGADIVSLLHISPAHNQAFKRITSPGLAHLGDSATGVWSKITSNPPISTLDLEGGAAVRFKAVSTEELFGRFLESAPPVLQSWVEYIRARYGWVRGLNLR